MKPEDQERTLIHELMHIPAASAAVFAHTKDMLNAKMLRQFIKNCKKIVLQRRRIGYFSHKLRRFLHYVFKVRRRGYKVNLQLREKLKPCVNKILANQLKLISRLLGFK